MIGIPGRFTRYADETRTYWREARTTRDFLRVMRVRLSQSKVGPLVCPRPVTVDVDLASLGRGVRLRSHTTDVSVLGELLVGRSYEKAATALDTSTSRIVDLGANTGLAARWLLERFPSARIVSVEPEQGNVAALRHNLAPYGERARVLAACIGARERQVALDTSRGEFGVSMRELGDADETGDATVVTMDSVLAELGDESVDFLKCDVEGAERELFESHAEWVTRVGLMSVECHHPFTPERLFDLLRQEGPHVEVLNRESTPEFECETVTLRLTNAVPARRPSAG